MASRVELGRGMVGGRDTVNIFSGGKCAGDRCPFFPDCHQYNGDKVITIRGTTRNTVQEVKDKALCIID